MTPRTKPLPTVVPRIDELRELLNNAAGEAFLPPGWQRLVAALPALLNIAEAADELSCVTTHVNCTGEEYADRRDSYALLRKQLGGLR